MEWNGMGRFQVPVLDELWRLRQGSEVPVAQTAVPFPREDYVLIGYYVLVARISPMCRSRPVEWVIFPPPPPIRKPGGGLRSARDRECKKGNCAPLDTGADWQHTGWVPCLESSRGSCKSYPTVNQPLPRVLGGPLLYLLILSTWHAQHIPRAKDGARPGSRWWNWNWNWN